MNHCSITPYLTYSGRGDEAINFYVEALDAKIEFLMRFDESPDPLPDVIIQSGFRNKIMHASLNIQGARLNLSDGCDTFMKMDGFSLSLAVPTPEIAERYFQNLALDGKVTMPLGATFWSPCFGMVTDKFNVSWMIIVPLQDT